jgi:predicted Co/Zn/Cd cation transporter (cation efflux family)
MFLAAIVAAVAAKAKGNWAGTVLVLGGVGLCLLTLFVGLLVFGLPHGGSGIESGWSVVVALLPVLGFASIVVGVKRLRRPNETVLKSPHHT